MPKKNRIARISITLPEEVLREADRLAAELDRPRSWVLAEGVRRWTSIHAAGRAPQVVRESPAAPYPAHRPGLGELRSIQLEADMALGVDERVRQAEEELHANPLGGRASGTSIRFFDRYEDYLEWKKFEGIRA